MKLAQTILGTTEAVSESKEVTLSEDQAELVARALMYYSVRAPDDEFLKGKEDKQAHKAGVLSYWIQDKIKTKIIKRSDF
jgi:hypothetical protein